MLGNAGSNPAHATNPRKEREQIMKWKFLILSEDCDLFGTNSEEHATACSMHQLVWDVATGLPLGNHKPIPEVPEGWHTNPDTGKYWSAEQ